MAIQILLTGISAFISAAVAFGLSRVTKKLDDMSAEQERHRKEQIEVRVAERNLVIAEAKISALSARCIRGEHVNGDLEAAEKYLQDCRHKVENLAHRVAIEKLEEQ